MQCLFAARNRTKCRLMRCALLQEVSVSGGFSSYSVTIVHVSGESNIEATEVCIVYCLSGNENGWYDLKVDQYLMLI